MSDFDGGLPPAALDQSNIGAMQAGQAGQVFLRETSRQTRLLEHSREANRETMALVLHRTSWLPAKSEQSRCRDLRASKDLVTCAGCVSCATWRESDGWSGWCGWHCGENGTHHPLYPPRLKTGVIGGPPAPTPR